MCVFGPGPLWFKGHWQCHYFSHLLCPLSCFNPLELYQLGANPKVRQSVQTMFSLAHSYGNILREGLEGSAGLSPGALQGQTAAAANG